jgi:hypothetical protein
MITTPNITRSHRNGHHPPLCADPAPATDRNQPQPPRPPGNPAAIHAGKIRPARPATMAPIPTRPNDFALSPAEQEEGETHSPRNASVMFWRVICAALLTAVLAGIVFCWHLLTSGSGWSWNDLPSFGVAIKPSIWTFLIPMVLLTALDFSRKTRIWRNSQCSMTCW